MSNFAVGRFGKAVLVGVIGYALAVWLLPQWNPGLRPKDLAELALIASCLTAAVAFKVST